MGRQTYLLVKLLTRYHETPAANPPMATSVTMPTDGDHDVSRRTIPQVQEINEGRVDWSWGLDLLCYLRLHLLRFLRPLGSIEMQSTRPLTPSPTLGATTSPNLGP